MGNRYHLRSIVREGTAILAFVALAAVGCSRVLDFGNECATETDCVAKHGAGWACDPRYWLCYKTTTPVEDQLETDVGSQDVPQDTGWKPLVLKPPCQKIYGVKQEEATAPDVILIGTLLSYSGELAPDGPKIDQGVELAVSEINQAGGLFGKKIGVISCDDGTDTTVALESAKQLVDSIGGPVVIGATPSSVTIEVFNKVAKAKGVLMMSPSSTSPLLTNLPDDGLVWRTAPSDAIQGAAVAAYLNEIKPAKVAVVVRNDAYGNGLATVIYDRYCKTKTPPCSDADYLSRTYSVDSDAKMSDDQTTALVEMKKLKPDVIVLVAYFSDGVAFVNMATDAGFKKFVLTDGMKDPVLLDKQSGIHDTETRCRLIGTMPKGTGAAYDAFAFRYKAQFKQDPGSFSAHGYDAMYLVGYALATIPDDQLPFTGAKIAAGLRRLASGTKVNAGASDWNKTIQTLRNNPKSTVDYEGASGPLNFDLATGEAPSDIEMWRLDIDGGKVVGLGTVYSADGKYTTPDFDPAGGGKDCAAFTAAAR